MNHEPLTDDDAGELYSLFEFKQMLKQGLINEHDGTAYYADVRTKKKSLCSVSMKHLVNITGVFGYSHIIFYSK